ncbi:MAG TPA: hypothetical protein HA272_03970 [Methanoregula sp.]|nr:hypothetical protein [Methanoregula sp.]
MKSGVRYGVLALLVLAALAVLAISLSGPLLYSLDTDRFPSQHHVNTNALKAQELNSTTDVLPLMQDLLDYSGPIVLNIRAGDVEGAKRDLEAFAKTRRSFDNLVLKLDMTESEIKEFSESQKNQEKILSELLNTSVTLDQLASLEIQYRNENNPTMLSTIRLQGDALKTKINSLSEQYNTEAQTSVTIGKETGLDTSSGEESIREFREYAVEVSSTKPRQQLEDIPIRRSSQLSLLIYPDSVRYGDTIRCFGYFFSQYGYRIASTPDKPVTLYLDETAIGKVTTDTTGSYTLEFPLGRVTPGTHILHAESGTTRSDQRILTVIPIDSVTALKVTTSKVPGNVTCTGTVTSGKPVRHAPVELVLDGKKVKMATTGSAGEFKETITLPAGVHTVQARFTGTGYPVNPSESEVQTVIVPPAAISTVIYIDNSIFVLVIVFIVLGLSGAGALWYSRRAPAGAAPPAAGPAGTQAPEPEEDEGALPDLHGPALPAGAGAAAESALAERYAAILTVEGLDAACHTAYSDLASRLARDHRIARHRVLTPREMAQSCKKRPYCSAFSRLVSAYERIRYGGCDTEPIREEFEASMERTDARMRGEEH